MVSDFADKRWLREVDRFDDEFVAPVTFCDRCTLCIGAVFVFAPIFLAWAEWWLP